MKLLLYLCILGLCLSFATSQEDGPVTTPMPLDETDVGSEMEEGDFFEMQTCPDLETSNCARDRKRAWACDFTKYVIEQMKWMAEFKDWVRGCAEHDENDPMYQSLFACKNYTMVRCTNPEQRRCRMFMGCEMCGCMDSDYMNWADVKDMWKKSFEGAKKLMELYKMRKMSCTRTGSDGCDEPGSGMGSGMGSGDRWNG